MKDQIVTILAVVMYLGASILSVQAVNAAKNLDWGNCAAFSILMVYALLTIIIFYRGKD